MNQTKVFLGALFSGCLFVGCATTEKVPASAVTPAAQAEITVDGARGGRTELDVEVKHMAKPQQIGANHYIVWVQPEGSPTLQNVGTLEIGDDLEGELETTVPYDKFRVVVTPEAETTVAQPSGPIIFDKMMTR